MRRPLWFRSLIAVWAVWLGAVLLGPAELHACPAHGSHAAHQMSADDMAGMDHNAPQSAPSHDANGQCNCVGACALSAAVAAPVAQVATVSIENVVTVAHVFPAHDDEPPVAAPPHSLPFANGPPARV